MSNNMKRCQTVLQFGLILPEPGLNHFRFRRSVSTEAETCRPKMNTKVITTQSRIVLILAVALCEFLGVGLLLTAVSFAIERSDLDANPHVRIHDQLRLSRAVSIATYGFLVMEIAATWALIKVLSRRMISRFQAGVRAVLTFVALGVLSYLIMIAALKGLAVDPLLSAQRSLAHWILTIVN